MVAVLEELEDGYIRITSGSNKTSILLGYWLGYEFLYKVMQENSIRQLWVYPDTEISRNVSVEDIENIHPGLEPFTPAKRIYDGQPATIRMHVKGDINRFVTFPAHMECCIPAGKDRGQWKLSSPLDLHATLDYLEGEIGIPFIYSAGKAGETILRAYHGGLQKPIERLDPASMGFFQNVLRGMMDRAIWKQKDMHSGLLGMWLVGVDKNGQYIGGANAALLGNGNFRHVSRYDKSYTGFWKYRIIDVSNTPFNGVTLPCPLDVRKQWASTALIEAAIAQRVGLDISEGIIWDRKARYLEKWANIMWYHRMNLRNNTTIYPDKIARSNAERSVKLMSNGMVGRFMNEYSQEYFHPDWQAGIIHQACASQCYTLARLWREHGVHPVLVNKDAFYILLDNPGDVNRLNLLNHSNELRGFKQIGACKITSEILDAFHSKAMDINQLEGIIKKAMKEYQHVTA